MVAFGTTCLLLGTLAAVWAAVSSFLGGALRSTGFVVTGRRAVYSAALLMTLSVGTLEYLLLTDNFSVEYVFQNSHRTQPLFFKIGALWGGQAGSLLFWAWILSIYALVLVFWNRHRHRELMPYATGVLMSTLVFFGLVLSIVTPPFRPGIAHADGMGMNPLLQNYWMVIHPPCLYLGYVGFAVPFAFGVAALISKRTGEVWIRTTRRWTIFAWFFLGFGILLGSYWAYIELGWGGYWAWDPVETASFMPWLVGTAFLHSVMIQERRRMLRLWNLALVILTFSLTLFGTFLTRSGVIASVHAFSQGSIGVFFLSFLALVVLTALALIAWRWDTLGAQGELDSVVSRESAFLLNNVLLVAATFTVFFGTVFPLLSEAVRDVKVSVGAPFFNQVNVPLFLSLIFLMGVGPLIAWRRASIENLKRNFLWPVVVGIVAAAVLRLLGVGSFVVLVSLGLTVFVAATITVDLVRATRARRSMGERTLPALGGLLRRHNRRYGGFVVHLAVLVVAVGVTGSQTWSVHTETTLKRGEQTELGGYRIRFDGLRESQESNHGKVTGTFTLLNGRAAGTVLQPAKKFYPQEQSPIAYVDYRLGLIDDVYVVLGDFARDGTSATVKLQVNRMVSWIWIGGLVLTLGTVLAVLPERRKVA